MNYYNFFSDQFKASEEMKDFGFSLTENRLDHEFLTIDNQKVSAVAVASDGGTVFEVGESLMTSEELIQHFKTIWCWCE